MNLQKNMTGEAVITDMTDLGCGICRVDGTVVFVRGGVTGDRLRYKIIKPTQQYAVAMIEELLAPSSYRAKPQCDAFRRCGGCAFLHVDDAYEATLKEAFLSAAFRRAGLSPTVHPLTRVSPLLPYRNKAQYPIASRADGSLFSGFYAEKSHTVVPGAERCLLQPPLFGEVLRACCTFLYEHGASTYQEQSSRGLIRHICLREAESGMMVTVVANGDSLPAESEFFAYLHERFPRVVSLYLNINRSAGNRILGDVCRKLGGDDAIYDVLCGLRFSISPLSFYQVNRPLAERLYEKAAELLNLRDDDTLLDLYCGTGTIGLSMARQCASLVGVEIVPQAIADARRNADANNIENAEFFCGDAGDILKTVQSGRRFTAVVVDPPRRGLDAAVVDLVSAMHPERICYISCNPDTLARDLTRFADDGYYTNDAYPFDMFPKTGHVETVVLLSRKSI